MSFSRPHVYRIIALWTVLVLCLMAAPAQADTRVLRLDPALPMADRSVVGRLEGFYDPGGELTQAQVSSPPYVAQFAPIDAGLNAGYADGAWWVRFQIQASGEPPPGGWWLRLGAPHADYLDAWLPVVAADGSIGVEERQLGRMRAVSTRELPWTLQAVQVPPLPDGQAHWVWVRLAGDRALSFIGGASPLRELADMQQKVAFGTAAVVGMAFIMALVSLMIGIALPERRFVTYAGYLLTVGLLFLSSENLQAVLWFPDRPAAAVRMHGFAVCLHMLAAMAFARSLLDTKREFARVDRVLLVLMGGCAVAGLVSLGGGYGLVALPLNLVWISFAVGAVLLCVALLRRNPQAWPNLLGYAVYLLVGVLHFAKNLQWLPFTLMIQYSYALGALIHVLAFFFALGWRVRTRERTALALSQLHGDRLEQRVRERTQALRDEIVQHRRTHDQLALALREQRGLLAMVSHEFRTPLGTIGGTAELLTDERLDIARDDVRREAAKISRTVLRMRDLVDTLLADEWLESSSQNLHLTPIALAGFLQEKCEHHESEARRGGLALEVADPGLWVRMDESLLHIALDNLLTNAIKYSPADSPVWVWAGLQQAAPGDGLESTGPRVCIRVSDQGPGFQPQDLPHIFERFYRSKAVRRIPGIGLGLHMVQRIAHIHHGTLTARNRPQGGAELTLLLPLFVPESAGGTRPAAE